jgi:hypothetical protein
MAAVKQDVEAIRYIDDPSEQAQLAAVQQDPSLVYVIRNPSPWVLLAV